jgi:arsenite transporter
LPLLLAGLTEWHAQRYPDRPGWSQRLGNLPVPLLAIVVFLIAASQVGAVLDSLAVLPHALLIFMVYLVAAGVLAWLIAGMFRLEAAAGRTLAFSLGTRNSFVVLPLALALPAGWEVAAVVIVFQSLVELFGMSLYLWWVPRKLFPPPDDQPDS